MSTHPRPFTPAIRRAMTSTVAVILVAPVAASAQLSTTRGLSVGVHLLGTSLAVESGDQQGGGGLGLHLGYGFNRIVTGFVNVDGAQIDITDSPIVGDWSLSHVEVGARFHFANSLRRWVPYLEVSAGGRSVSIEAATVNGQSAGKVDFSGGALTFGAGLSAYVTRTFALDASLKWTGGEFTKVDVGAVSLNNLDIDAASARFGLGFVWWPKS